jgi:hypothetical protein
MLSLLAALAASSVTAMPSETPLALNPANPHYFTFRGKPTVLITSGEHYGSVLNLDMRHEPYLDALKRDGLNLTRTFSGVYCESPADFNIRENTLAPAANRYITPWARSSQPGYPNGGNRFDLTKWDDAYFARLKSFVSEAEKRGIVVELVLFCPFYGDSMWNLSPMNAKDNVNGVGTMPRDEVYTLKHPEMVAVHDAVVTKIVTELRDAPNLYYEICNEPYFGGVTLEWQKHISETIAKAESGLPHRHLIAQNIANDWAKVENPNPLVSIFNFHYASPPRAVYENYRLGKAIAFDETGFKGSDDFTYRAQAWEFLLAGGAVFDNLDYSFTAAKPEGTMHVSAPTPGGGSPELRRQLSFLKRFMAGLDFVHMAPDLTSLKSAGAGVTSTLLSRPGMWYAAYFQGGTKAEARLDLPGGDYQVEWLDPAGCKSLVKATFTHGGGVRELDSPPYTQDVVMRIRRR